MKKILAIALFTIATAVPAAIVTFDLSPPGTDHAVGLSPANETPPVLNSTGSGNEIGPGITFDTSTLTLSLSLGYGSAFGFSNLTCPATAAHIHGPAPTNTPAPIVVDLAGLNVLAANPANGGSIVGSIVLATNQSLDLLSGLYYINVHTSNNPAGEIRGQLIPVDTLPTVVCPASTNAECAGPNGTLVTLTAGVSDEDGDALTVVWSANGVAVQTNTVAAGSSTNVSSVSLAGLFQLGTNTVVISVSDGIGAPVGCTVIVTIVDTTPPVITSASVTPTVLWPPNHKMIPIQVSATATDICGSVEVKIKSIGSNQSPNAKGSGKKSDDWRVTGDLSALLRSERTGKDKGGRIYTITVEAIDQSGNTADTTLVVTVPHDQGHGGSSTNDPGDTLPGNSNGHGNGHGKNK
jgi:hypothetical protein